MSGDISNAVLFTVIGAFIGIVLVILSSWIVPIITNRLTPRIDEEKELVRGNRAVAEYYGRLVAAVIIGISIVIAAAIIAGIHGW